ncbi:hypothetical protein DWB85_17955 [Seongchinamella sediminis]|uniref:Uncharacterized protein n=1 Tax=Seongchinamella sediminis TaxID=2283635 RepID=A0A3L7DUW4_9GAMM|nr:hypothetical protein [Seongchinamella sediminis]RLQ20380.1 hypothetical protein DWB85_17955 [Seongchinamella sediminis]
MKRFDLTFKGDILPDHEPDQVRHGFAELFRIRDPLVLDELFSGDAFVLRSNLDRKAAADYYRRITDLGGVAQLVPSDRPAANSTSSAPEIFTRVSTPDPAALHFPRRGEIISVPSRREPPPEPIAKAHDPESEPEPEALLETVTDQLASEPPKEQVLARLRSLRHDAEAALASRVEQLQQMQDEIKSETSAALEQIKLQREEVLLASQDEFSRLQALEAQSREKLEQGMAALGEEEQAQQRQLEQQTKHADDEARSRIAASQSAAEQLHLDRDSCQREAENNIAQLEAQIAAVREQVLRDVAEFDQLIAAAEQARDQEAKALETRLESVQQDYDQALGHLQARRQEHEQQLESELEEIRTLREQTEHDREDKLTELWEREERAQHDAQERLRQLEETRKRQLEALEQRLARLKLEEEKLTSQP